MEKREPSHTAGRIYIGIAMVWSFHKKLKTELPYDPAIPLLGLYLEKNKIRKDICTAVFVAALFTLPNTQDTEVTKKSIDRGMDKETWYIYAMEYNQPIRRMK